MLSVFAISCWMLFRKLAWVTHNNKADILSNHENMQVVGKRNPDPSLCWANHRLAIHSTVSLQDGPAWHAKVCDTRHVNRARPPLSPSLSPYTHDRTPCSLQHNENQRHHFFSSVKRSNKVNLITVSQCLKFL